jgi:hypothetical protein
MEMTCCASPRVLQSSGFIAQNFTKPTGGSVLPYSGAAYFIAPSKAEALFTLHKNAIAPEITADRNPILPQNHILLPGIQINEIRPAGET